MPNLQKGRTYNVELRLNNQQFISRGSPFFCRGGLRLGAVKRIAPEEEIENAVQIASVADSE